MARRLSEDQPDEPVVVYDEGPRPTLAPRIDVPEPIRVAIRKLLGKGGALSRRNDLYEERPQQIEMADAVAEALLNNTHAVIEAGTGTGKTLAYLIPALLSRQRVVISTATKALQEQLVEKDLPLLQDLLSDFTFAIMKGRQNYLCLYRKEQFDAHPVFVSKEEASLYPRLRKWAQTTQTGDRAELDLPENYAAWRDVSSTTETCLGEKCPRYGECHVVRMKMSAQAADVVVVNHHLFFADLAVRRTASAPGVGVIPRYQGVVFDEAHNIEEVASTFFGLQISNWRFVELCRDFERLASARKSYPVDRIRAETQKLERSVDAFFKAVAELAPPDVVPRTISRGPRTSVVLPRRPAPVTEPEPRTASLFEAPRGEVAASDDEVLSRAVVIESRPGQEQAGERRESRWTLERGALAPADELRGALFSDIDGFIALLRTLAEDGADAEIDAFKVRAADAKATVQAVTELDDPSFVYWGELRGRSVALSAAPIDVSQFLREALFSQTSPAILTSATLAAGGDTKFLRRRVGMLVGDEDVRPTRELVLHSPFDYSRQAALYVPRHVPDPADEAFIPAAVEEIAALIALAQGRTFALFTSFRVMNEVHRRLAPRIPYRVLLQGQKPKSALLRDFREVPSVLFATQSFWEGVDIQGDALSMVIIDKLPFGSPGDPLLAARLKAIQERGGSPFGEYQLPSAAITLKQGFGRLIRSRQDTGCVAILDRRLWTKGYGSYFRRSLPDCPTFDRFPDIKQWWREVRGHAP